MLALLQDAASYINRFQSIQYLAGRGLLNGLQAEIIVLCLLAGVLVRRLPLTALGAGTARVAAHVGRQRWFPAWMLVATFLSSVALAHIYRPAPAVHDEWSYQLAAETFAAGRLTSPPHPLADHMEAFHVNQTPTHQSKYLPGSGLIMALGIKLANNPLLGIWLATAACVAALVWMLQGLVEPPLVFVGALLSWSTMVFSYLGQTFFGSTLVALGGALAVGAGLRLRGAPTVKGALILGLGVAILALSRPFEGLLLTVPLLQYLVMDPALKEAAGARRRDLIKVALPFAGVVFVALAWLAYYNFRVTGHPLTFAYQVYEAKFMKDPVLLFQRLNEKVEITSQVVRDFMTSEFPAELRYREQVGSLLGFGVASWFKVWDFGRFFLGAALFIPFVFGLVGPSSAPRQRRLLRGLMTAFLLTILSTTYWLAHYGAAFYGAILLVILFGLREIIRSPPTRFVSPPLLAVSLVATAVITNVYAGVSGLETDAWRAIAGDVARIRAIVATSPSPRVVFVRGRTAGMQLTLTANHPNPDAADTVWVWDLGRAKNQRVLNYYPDRYPYLVEEVDPQEAHGSSRNIWVHPYEPDAEHEVAGTPELDPGATH